MNQGSDIDQAQSFLKARVRDSSGKPEARRIVRWPDLERIARPVRGNLWEGRGTPKLTLIHVIWRLP